jgi:hypothetical protein
MESLNLNALAGSLPTSNLANAEKELLNNFRGIYSRLFIIAIAPMRRFTHPRFSPSSYFFTHYHYERK